MEIIAYIDCQNVHLGIKQLGHAIDRARFLIYLKDKHRVTKAKVFLGYIAHHQEFYDTLIEYGYEVILRKTIRIDGTIKGNIDTLLMKEAMNDFYIYNNSHLLLVSGDGDFDILVEQFYKANRKVKILLPSFARASKLLFEVAGPKVCYNLMDVLHKIVVEHKKDDSEESPHRVK